MIPYNKFVNSSWYAFDSNNDKYNVDNDTKKTVLSKLKKKGYNIRIKNINIGELNVDLLYDNDGHVYVLNNP